MKEEPNFLGRMSRPYDSMDPKVMDDDMLKAAVGEQGPQEEAGQLAKQEGILFKDVLSLQLDFQSKCPGCQECGLGQQGLPDFLCPVSDPQISQSQGSLHGVLDPIRHRDEGMHVHQIHPEAP